MTDSMIPSPGDGSDEPREWSVVDHLGRAFHVKEAGLAPTLNAILQASTDVIDPATAAGVNLFVKGQFEPQAVYGEAPPRLDAWQKEHGVGPCIDASREQVTVSVDDTASEARWTGFGGLAVELGIGSMLCVPLWLAEARLGSLSLYASAPAAFSRHDERLAHLIGTQASLALGDAQRVEQLRVMAANRDLIGQAKGILMERHKITSDQAFDLLRERSQRSNRKLVDVAETVVATGSLD
jgi:GAF domain-containing protein